MEGLVHTKADIVGEQIKGVALATDLKDVSNILYCCYVMSPAEGSKTRQ